MLSYIEISLYPRVSSKQYSLWTARSGFQSRITSLFERGIYSREVKGRGTDSSPKPVLK